MYVVSIFTQALFFSSKYQSPRQDYAQHLQYPIVLTLVLLGNHIETQVRQSLASFFPYVLTDWTVTTSRQAR